MTNLREIFDYLGTAILVFDADGRCCYANDACQTLLVRSLRWLQGRDPGTIFPLNSEIISQCEAARADAQSIVLREIEVHLPDWQRSLLLDINVSPYALDTKAGVILEMNDRKEVSKLSHDTNTAAIFKAATRIVRGLCHEIKNPLGGIRGAAQLLSLEVDSDETAEYTSVITREVDRLSELLSRMSGGGGAFNKEHIDIHRTMAEVAELLKAEHGESLEIGFDFDTSLPGIEANLDSLTQALLNIFKNAAQWALIENPAAGTREEKSGNQKASICIKTRTAYPDLRRSLMPQRGIRIQVLDNGPGVDASIMDQIFLPMVTRREGGTGLGLSISQEIVQSHGGFIELDEPQESHDTCFSVYLPYQPDAAAPLS